MTHQNIDGSAITFEQDRHIHFEESTHTYTVDGIGMLTPVSTVISKFFSPFDATYWSLRKCNGDEVSAAKMREEWSAKGAIASQSGTFLHKQIEIYLNEKKEADLDCAVTYDGEYVHLRKNINIATEWEYFKAFDKNTRYTPFRTEWCVYDCDAKMAGTIDLLCSCADGTYEMYDWKRSNRIDPAEINTWANGINGLEHLTDTAYSHYCLQQNLYRYILEKNYGLSISHMHLVILHPELPCYRLIAVPRMEHEINIIIEQLSNNN
jgi:hypothetical protein